MKKLNIWFLGAVLALGTASPALAAKFVAGDNATIGNSETANGNVYAAGGNVNYTGSNSGDLFTVGGTLTISGKISEDLMAAGGNIILTGDVGDDVRVAGGSVTLNSKIGGDVMAAGGNVNLSSSASTSKDVYIAGGTLVIDGTVGGNLIATAGKVEIRGMIKGSAKIRTDKLVIGEGAVVVGVLDYSSPEETLIPGSAKIGKVQYEQAPPMQKKGEGVKKGVVGAGAFFKLVGQLVFCLVLFAIFKRKFTEITSTTLIKFWPNVLTGFVTLITVPVALILLAITLFGLPFTFAGFTIFSLLLQIGGMGAGAVFGTWLWFVFARKNGYTKVSWITITVGAIVLTIISLVPVLGWLVAFAFFLALFGQISRMFYEGIRRAR